MRNSGIFKLKHFNQLCFHMLTLQCPDEQNVIDRSGNDLNVAVYQSYETSRDIHLFYGWVRTNAGSAESCSSFERFSTSYRIRLSNECLN